ncbi:hypothetical protein [Enterococcus sp. HY326]|uniref:hypothetical protein n=1 Tax=Enterococcus sp. HY326 TaxID=2971265 RepID=UPI00223F49E5|nr:hypothetical protein [Enterococcus sp. HY326]
MNRITNNRWLKKESIRVLFFALLLSLLFVMPLLIKGDLVYGDDLVYHLSRIKELVGWLMDGEFNFPGISTRSFYLIGYGVNLFYPWITLVPFAFLSQLFENAAFAISLGFFFYTFLTAWIAYWCMKRFSQSWVASVSFTLFYVFATYRTIDGLTRFALPEFIALTFLPLLVWSTYEVLFKEVRSWIWVTISFALIVCTHVLSAFLISLYLVLFWVGSLYFIREKVKRTFILIGAGGLAIAGSAFFLIPFLEEQLFQTFLQPSPVTLAGNTLSELLGHGLTNDLTQSSLGGIYTIGLPCLLVLMFGCLFWKKMTRTYRLIYILSWFTFWLSTDLFPWGIFQHTIINVIQYPFRLMMFTTLFTCLTGANIVKLISEDQSLGKRSLLGLLGVNLILCFLPWLISVQRMMDQAYSFASDTETIFFEDPDNRYSMWIDQYAPASSQPYIDEIYQHVGYIDGDAYLIPPQNQGQKIQYSMQIEKDQTSIDLPIIRYKNTIVWVNQKEVDMTSSERGTVQIEVDSGPTIVEVGYKASKVIRISFYISFFTWLVILLRYFFYELYRKLKKVR